MSSAEICLIRGSVAPFQINVDNVNLSLHACADSLPAVGLFLSDLSSILQGTEQKYVVLRTYVL